MKLLQFLIPLMLLTLAQTTFAACTLGEKEDHLTIERVMRNFGRFTRDAELISLKGVIPYEKITDDQLKVAIEKLGWAIDCAQAVLDDPNDAVIPTEAKKKLGDDRAEHVDDYLYFMTDFRDGLQEYRQMFIKALEAKPEERNYAPIREKCLELDKLINHAHKKT